MNHPHHPHGFDPALLPTLPLFRQVPEELLQRIMPEQMIRYYGDGDVLFREGEEADSLVILLQGRVRFCVNGTPIQERQAYAVIGEQAFIDQTTRSATALAQGLVQALILPREIVEHLMKHPIFIHNLLLVVNAKLRQATNERAFHYRNEHLLFSEFRAHLSPEVTQRLLATGVNYGAPRYIDAIILFADIRSFTQQSDKMLPEEIAHQLNPYFDAMVSIIHRHQGLVDKFIGDAVMAVWGYAPSEGDLAMHAFTCAQEMIQTAAQMCFGGKPIAIGVGLNAGKVFIGNVGGEGKRQFTVLGAPVNLAARYEGETKVLGAPLVLGQAFYDRLPPEVQSALLAHSDRPIKGADNQTLYTVESAAEETEGAA